MGSQGRLGMGEQGGDKRLQKRSRGPLGLKEDGARRWRTGGKESRRWRWLMGIERRVGIPSPNWRRTNDMMRRWRWRSNDNLWWWWYSKNRRRRPVLRWLIVVVVVAEYHVLIAVAVAGRVARVPRVF